MISISFGMKGINSLHYKPIIFVKYLRLLHQAGAFLAMTIYHVRTLSILNNRFILILKIASSGWRLPRNDNLPCAYPEYLE